MKTFNGLKEGTVITNPVDGNMTVRIQTGSVRMGRKNCVLKTKQACGRDISLTLLIGKF